jgi:hypothetical protein
MRLDLTGRSESELGDCSKAKVLVKNKMRLFGKKCVGGSSVNSQNRVKLNGVYFSPQLLLTYDSESGLTLRTKIMPHRCNMALNVNPVIRDDLARLVQSSKTPAGLYRRALAVSLLIEGVRPGEAARLSRLDRTNVFRWARRFQRRGVGGLEDLPRHRAIQPQAVAAPKTEPPGARCLSPLAEALRQIEARKVIFGDE